MFFTPSCRPAFLRWLVLAVALPSLAVQGQDFTKSEFRRWTTVDGIQSQVRLRARGVDANQVRLVREDGGTVVLPLSRLSRGDLQYLRALRRGPVQAEPQAKQGWPRWRGPQNNGISQETGLLKQWPEGGPRLLWTANGLGSGYSSVAIWDGTIYTMGDDQGTTNLIALSEDDGELLWKTEAGGGDAPNCTPTVDPATNRVYGVSFDGELTCVDGETGAKTWQRSFSEDFGGRMMSMWGFSESPLVDGDRLICTPGSDTAVMAALDKQTGKTVWTTPMPGGAAGYASPVISQAGGIKHYVTMVGKGLIGVAADDGRLLWRYERIANTTANIPTPIVHGDLVFGSSGYGDGGSALLRLHRQGDSLRVEELYYLKNNQLQNHHGGMVRIGDVIYLGHGHNKGLPVCFHLKQGQPLWGPTRGPGTGSAAVTAADGKLYFRYQNGVMALIDASTERLQIDGQFQIKSRHGESWAHPVISNKRLYLRDQHQLHCYDIGA